MDTQYSKGGEQDKPQITPEMIEAGVLVLDAWDSRLDAPEWVRQQIVASVYEAMAHSSLHAHASIASKSS
jgi:hypothetical protein